MNIKNLHSKQKGSIGELAIAKHLVEQGFPVFKELGDSCKVDLIALVDNKPIKIQVKTSHSLKKRSVAYADTRSSGPGYCYTYTDKDVDIIAVHVYDYSLIFYVPIRMFNNSRGLSFRLTSPKNKQSKNIRYVESLKTLRRCIE